MLAFNRYHCVSLYRSLCWRVSQKQQKTKYPFAEIFEYLQSNGLINENDHVDYMGNGLLLYALMNNKIPIAETLLASGKYDVNGRVSI